MTDQKTIARRITRLKDFMDELYPTRPSRKTLPVLDELILTILSQHTSDINSSNAFENLVATFPSWDLAAIAPAGKIAEAIRTGGLAKMKAPRIKSILREVYESNGSYDLQHVRKMPFDEAMEYLLHFKGVGLKTASCVLLFSCGLPAFPADTHIERVSKRLGLISNKENADRATEVFMKHTDPKTRYKFHIDIIHFGREICHPRNPECEKCALTRICTHYKNVISKN